MIKDVLSPMEDKMKKTIEALKKDLQSIKAGRANPAILDKITIDYYGTPTPVAQLSNISTPESRLIVIQPWEKNLIKDIEKAIQKSDLGLNPSNDGHIIRLIIPELTEETRKNTVKTIKKHGEEAKVAVRSIRRDSNEKLKTLKKDANFSEDEIKRTEEEVQKLTDNYIKELDKVVESKEKEIMSL